MTAPSRKPFSSFILPPSSFVMLGAVFGLCCHGADWAGEPVNPNLSREALQVLDYLESTYQKQVLAGYNVYVHTPDDYEQTGKQAAIWGRDIRWLGDVEEIVQHVKRHRYILTLHWHWFFGEDSAWTGKRKTPVDVGKMVTLGTNEYKQAIAEMDAAADKLQILEDAGIPVLWRPLHELDGGLGCPVHQPREQQCQADDGKHDAPVAQRIAQLSAGDGPYDPKARSCRTADGSRGHGLSLSTMRR